MNSAPTRSLVVLCLCGELFFLPRIARAQQYVFVGKSADVAGSGNSCTVAIPNNVYAANCCVAQVAVGDQLGGTNTFGAAPAGWTNVAAASVQGAMQSQGAIYIKSCGVADENVNVTFNWTCTSCGTVGYNCRIAAWAGSTCTVDQAISAFSNSSSTSGSVGPVTTTAGNELVLGYNTRYTGGATNSAPPSLTQRYDDPVANMGAFLGDLGVPAGFAQGSTGTFSWTFAGATTFSGAIVTLMAGVAATPTTVATPSCRPVPAAAAAGTRWS